MFLACRGIGKLSTTRGRGTMTYQDIFVWRKLHFYGITVKYGGHALVLGGIPVFLAR